jgi:hypothetical protein
MIFFTYSAAKSAAVEVVAETVVNGTTIGLFKIRSNGYRFLIVTSDGGSEKCGRNEQLARQSFDGWVAALTAAA